MANQEWEYIYIIKPKGKEVKVIRQGSERDELFNDMMSILTMYGSHGWELVNANVVDWQDEYSLLLKRPG
jgi:hypothetical protein